MKQLFPKDKSVQISLSPHSPHNIIPKLIEPNNTVLDLGCNNGVLGIKLKHNNNIIDGVDINNKYFKKAKPYYRHLYTQDLSKPLILKHKYNYIVLSDILEHLPHPDYLLNQLSKLLKPGGKIIVSLPNIARLEIRIKLLFGIFDYSPGILSPDHLRFFTKDSAIKLLNNSGFSTQKIIPTGFGHMINILPTITAFQFIFVCSRSQKKK